MLGETEHSPTTTGSKSNKHLIVNFLLGEYGLQLERIMREDDDGRHRGLHINVLSLLDCLTDFGLALFTNPAHQLALLDAAITRAQSKILAEIGIEETSPTLRIHQRVHARLIGLPHHPAVIFDRIPGVEALGRLIAVRGTVTRVGQLRMQDIQRTFKCGKCGATQVMLADDRQYGIVPRPVICTNIFDDHRCGSTKFEVTIMEDDKVSLESRKIISKDDYQEVSIQENTSLLAVGAVPRSLTVLLQKDLVDECKAGDHVTIVGWLINRWKPVKTGHVPELEFALIANNVLSRPPPTAGGYSDDESATQLLNKFWHKHRQDIWKGRVALVESFCPQIHGMHLVKLAVLLTVIGGCNPHHIFPAASFASSNKASNDNNNNDNSSIDDANAARSHRREGHILLVGDPGTAKSQFLMSAARLLHRSVLTTGSGTTNAGLTVAAVKEAGSWQLEAGALVLADGGLCCIDEFNALRPHDRTAIHEAMEQQTLSVAKAGMVCKLATRCSILAACNARGGVPLEEGQPLSSNVALASPLLSRFDLILILTDRRDRQWDEQLSDAILQTTIKQRGHHPNPRRDVQKDNADLRPMEWDQLRAYVNHVRSQLNPTMSRASQAILGKYYQRQRRADLRDAARTTIRLLESLIRLAQAHAKLLGKMSVELSDAVWAIVLMETSLATQALLPRRPDLYAGPPPDPARQYEEYEELVLGRLDINKRILINFEENQSSDIPVMDVDVDVEAKKMLGIWSTTQPAGKRVSS